jgi:hybrid cluster-associated redox disulfide protein
MGASAMRPFFFHGVLFGWRGQRCAMPTKRHYRDDMTMDEIMRLWPATIRVVLDHGLLCVGCPIAPFHTVEDAIRAHKIDGEDFRDDLMKAIRGQQD